MVVRAARTIQNCIFAWFWDFDDDWMFIWVFHFPYFRFTVCFYRRKWHKIMITAIFYQNHLPKKHCRLNHLVFELKFFEILKWKWEWVDFWAVNQCVLFDSLYEQTGWDGTLTFRMGDKEMNDRLAFINDFFTFIASQTTNRSFFPFPSLSLSLCLDIIMNSWRSSVLWVLFSSKCIDTPFTLLDF